VSNLSFPLLPTDRYLSAVDQAYTNARKRLHKPEFGAFKHVAVQTYPQWFFVGIVGLLAVVMFFSFWVSAGKQIASAGMIFDDLPGHYSRLSSGWADVSVISMLMLSEFGAILFLVAAGTLTGSADSVRVVKNFHITPLVWILRLFAALCAAYAVVANITITRLDPVQQASAMQWLVSITIPVVVLGLGVILERLLVDKLKANGMQNVKYQEALIVYQSLWDDPTRIKDYGLLLAESLWTELNRYKQLRETLALVITSPELKNHILIAEYQSHLNAQKFDLEGSNNNPFLGSAKS